MPKDTKKFRAVRPRRNDMAIGEPQKENYPRIHFNLRDLPEARKWKIGETYHVAIEIKQTGIHEEKQGGGADFELRGIKVIPNKGAAPKEKIKRYT